MHSMETVIGIDVGGTSTRAVVLAGDGTIAGLATGSGANLNSSEGAASATLSGILSEVATRARTTLGGDPDVAACVAGMAGGGPAGRDRALTMLAGALERAGLAPATVDLVPDPLVAFAAGSPTADGVVLLAGTGAAAFSVHGLRQSQRSDGLGWMLGDVGGGIWLALEGFRAAAAHLDGRGPATALTVEALSVAVDVGPPTDDPRQDLVRLIHDRSPAQLGAFAPTVTRLAAEADPVAQRIVERAVAGLLTTFGAVELPPSGSIVLAGSVLTRPGPVRNGVLAGLSRPAHTATQPVVGALRLAADAAGWPLPALESLSSAIDGGRREK